MHQTNRALRVLELYGQDKSITREEFLAYKYDKKYSQESLLVEVSKKFIEDSNTIRKELI